MNRILSLDLARGFTVLFIPAIHTGMLYSRLTVHQTVLGQFLIAIAEGPGGQLLMLLMGFSFTLKAQHATRSVFVKSAGLLAAGYGLNILKFVVPYSIGVLPEDVLQELAVTEGEAAFWQLASMGDILHFAGMGLPVLHGLYKCPRYHVWALVAAVGIAVASPLIWDLHSGRAVLDYMLGLASGQPPRVFFPLFPWLTYPLIGLFVGYYFQQRQRDTALLCGIAGMALLVAGLWGGQYFPAENPAGFYRTPVLATCWHMGVVLLVFCLWYLTSVYVRHGAFYRLLVHSSKNITGLYIIQWVMICWMLPVFGFRRLDTAASVIVMVVMTGNTYLLNHAFQTIKLLLCKKIRYMM